MRKVKNNKVIWRIANKTRKASKSRNLIAIFAILLTTGMFTTVFTVGGSIVEKQQKANMRQQGGSAHVSYKYLTKEEYEIVQKEVQKDKNIKEVSYRIMVGDAVNDSLKKLPTEVNYYEDLDAKFHFCYPEVGHMPQKEDEIVTSTLVLKALDIPCKLGTKVFLKIDMGDKIIEDTFTLSGYFEGDTISPAQIAAVSKEYTDKVAPSPSNSAFEIKEIKPEDFTGRYNVDINFSNSLGLEKKLAELTKRCGFPANRNSGISWAYLTSEWDMGTIRMLVGFLIVILLSGYLIIYNIFYIHVFQDISYYGLLKTVGATGKQVKKIVRRQAFILSLYGIPAGLFLGVLFGKVLLPVLMSAQLNFSSTTNTNVVLNPIFFIGAALFTLLTIYISCMKPCRIASKVTPIEAIRYTEGQKEEKKEKKKRKKTKKVSPYTLALQNVRRSRKKAAFVIASLSLALVLLNSVFGLVSGFDMDKFISGQVISDFSVADATFKVTDGVTPEFQEALAQQKGVEAVGNIYVTPYRDKLPLTEEDFNRIKERVLENPFIQKSFLENLYDQNQEELDEFINQVTAEKGIDGRIYGVGKLAMEKLNQSEGDLDWEKFSTGKYIITGWFGSFEEMGGKGVNYFLPGEKVTLFNQAGESREYEVLAVAGMPYACSYRPSGFFDCDYILPEKEYLDFYGEQQPLRTLFDVEKKQEKKVEDWLSEYCVYENPDLDYIAKSTIVKEFNSVKNTYLLAGGLLVLALAVIGILNFINTMITSMLARKQELAMMEAVGMTSVQLKKMLTVEGEYYALYTAIFSIIFSIILSFTAIQSLGNIYYFFTWRFTITPLLLCFPFLILVTFLVPIICYKKSSKVSVVERMKRTE